MAQSKELQLQQGYQSPIQAQGYNPLQVADASQQMEQNRATALANAQREDAVLSKADEASIEFAKNLNTQQLADLSALSKSLKETAEAGMKMYWQAEATKGINAIREFGVPFEEYFNWHKTKKDLEIANTGYGAVANQLMAEGVPFEVANLYKGMSGIAKIHAKEEIVRQGAEAYFPWMQNQLQTNDTLILKAKDVQGNVIEFTPNQTSEDPIKRAQAIRALEDLYYEKFGFLGINRVILQDHAFEKMNQGRTKLIGEARFNFAQKQSAATRETAMVMLRQGNYLGAVNSLASTVDAEGRHIGRSGAHDLVFKMLGELDKATLLPEDVYQNLKKQPDPDNPGKTVGDRWEVRWKQFDLDRAANARAQDQADQGDRDLEARKAEEEFKQLFDNDPTQRTESNIKAAQERYFFLSGGKKSTYLDGLQSEYSVDAKAKAELNDRFEKLAEQNLLTTENVAQAPWSLQTKWMDTAKAQEATRTSTFKTHLKAIENHVKTDPRVKVSPDGSTSGIATLVIGELQAKFNSKVSEYVGAGMKPDQAANQAVSEVMAEFNVGSRYALDQTGNFSSFTLGTAKTSAAINGKLNKIRAAANGGGKASLNKKPGLIFNAAELKAMEDGYGEPGWTMPLQAQFWGKEFGISGLEVINRQRDAAGMRPLITPQSMEVASTAMSSQMQALLNRLPTYNRSVRALSSMGSFQPAIVPKGLGETIQKAAQTHGVDPSVLAGMLEKESSWRDDIISGRTKSSVGATGIAQFMPATAAEMGVNPLDVNSSINGAAKYLAKLTKQYGSVNAAMAHYAGYGGNAQDPVFIRDYLTPVLKNAAKYGYGQAWRDPATMRPSVVYKIGSLGYGSTGPHLDLKRVDRGTSVTTGSVEIKPNEVDNFVEVNVNGKWKALSKGTQITSGEAGHRSRAKASYGIDYAAPSGTPVRLKNGAQVVDTFKGEEGTDHLIIELPDGRRFQFLHGTKV